MHLSKSMAAAGREEAVASCLPPSALRHEICIARHDDADNDACRHAKEEEQGSGRQSWSSTSAVCCTG